MILNSKGEPMYKPKAPEGRIINEGLQGFDLVLFAVIAMGLIIAGILTLLVGH